MRIRSLLAAVGFAGLAVAHLPIHSLPPLPSLPIPSLPPIPIPTLPSWPKLPRDADPPQAPSHPHWPRSNIAKRQQTQLNGPITGFPLCGIAGTKLAARGEVVAQYVQTTYKESGASRSDCLNKCREQFVKKTGSCESVAFAAESGECLFFDRVVQLTDVVPEPGSKFVHYDLTCPVV